MRSRLRRTRRPLIALLALVVALIVGYAVRAGDSHDPSPAPSATSSSGSSSGGSSGGSSGTSTGALPLSALPPQAADTLRLVRAGGPFPFPRNDGVVFHNYEHALPREADGWYHEYTVPTPGSDDRGARRLITGRDGGYWYTGDHYDSFRRVDVRR